MPKKLTIDERREIVAKVEKLKETMPIEEACKEAGTTKVMFYYHRSRLKEKTEVKVKIHEPAPLALRSHPAPKKVRVQRQEAAPPPSPVVPVAFIPMDQLANLFRGNKS